MNVPGSRELAAAQALPTDHRRREKENMADFIAKKREIFLVQMSLDTKRAEIRKLEERALQVRGLWLRKLTKRMCIIWVKLHAEKFTDREVPSLRLELSSTSAMSRRIT